mgnify:CR=1 FL=1
MGCVGEQTPADYVDSVIAGPSPDADANEPLVMDFAAMHDGIDSSNPPIASHSSEADGNWPSDDDTAAAPPDIAARRDMSHHVPLRTR